MNIIESAFYCFLCSHWGSSSPCPILVTEIIETESDGNPKYDRCQHKTRWEEGKHPVKTPISNICQRLDFPFFFADFTSSHFLMHFLDIKEHFTHRVCICILHPEKLGLFGVHASLKAMYMGLKKKTIKCSILRPKAGSKIMCKMFSVRCNIHIPTSVQHFWLLGH